MTIAVITGLVLVYVAVGAIVARPHVTEMLADGPGDRMDDMGIAFQGICAVSVWPCLVALDVLGRTLRRHHDRTAR